MGATWISTGALKNHVLVFRALDELVNERAGRFEDDVEAFASVRRCMR